MPERLLLDVDCLEQSDELDFGEEPDVGGWLDPGVLDLFTRVSPTPALALGEGKNLRKQLEGIEAGLRRQFFAPSLGPDATLNAFPADVPASVPGFPTSRADYRIQRSRSVGTARSGLHGL